MVAVVQEMDVAAVPQDAWRRVTGPVHAAVDGLTPDELTWRPDPDANPIAWLVWHLSRVADDHVADVSSAQQVWTRQDWATRFALPDGVMDVGYGYTSQQVAAVRPASTQVLLDHHDAVAEEIATYLGGVLVTDRFGRPVLGCNQPPTMTGTWRYEDRPARLQLCDEHATQLAGHVRLTLDQ